LILIVEAPETGFVGVGVSSAALQPGGALLHRFDFSLSAAAPSFASAA
jgi:hypothetical protein